MTMPYMLYSGATSSEPDFVVPISKKQALLADARITKWLAARDGEVVLSSTDATRVTQMVDRKGGAVASAMLTDATRPVFAASAAFGGRKVVSFVDVAAKRSLSLSDLNLTGPFFIAFLLAKSVTATETIFRQAIGADQVVVTGLTGGSAPNASLFQFFRGAAGINVPTGSNGLDTAARLLFCSFDGASVQAAVGRGLPVSIAPSGSAAPAGSAADLGGLSASPFGGNIAQVIFGNVGILAAAHADLREQICAYAAEYYGLSI